MIVLCDSLLLCGDFNLRCQCIAGMFDSFPFRRILALGGCPLFRRGHAEFFRGLTSILSNYSLALCAAKATMVRVRRCVSKPILDRWMECARAEMARANMNDIRCPCRDCRLRILIRHDCGLLEAHQIRRGFMDGYTRWMQDDEDDDDVNDAAANGADEDEDARHEHDQDEDQGAGHQHDQDQGAGREHDEAEGSGHEHDEAEGSGHERHDEAEGEGNDSSWLRDPHVQELLLKETSNAKAAAREKARLEQMEKDAVTPLYEGCNDEDTRLTITLRALEMKAKTK